METLVPAILQQAAVAEAESSHSKSAFHLDCSTALQLVLAAFRLPQGSVRIRSLTALLQLEGEVPLAEPISLYQAERRAAEERVQELRGLPPSSHLKATREDYPRQILLVVEVEVRGLRAVMESLEQHREMEGLVKPRQ